VAPVSIPQTLSIYHPSDPNHWSRSRRNVRELEPPIIQQKSFAKWAAAGASVQELELANYWLQRPGMDREAVLDGQLEAAVELGCKQVWWWGLLPLLGSARTRQWFRERVGGEIS
jgi:hypothetical protein